MTETGKVGLRDELLTLFSEDRSVEKTMSSKMKALKKESNAEYVSDILSFIQKHAQNVKENQSNLFSTNA